MKMKKVISLVLSAAMAASLCGCLGGSNAATTAAESSAAGSTAAAGEETTAAAAETKEHSADAVGLKLSHHHQGAGAYDRSEWYGCTGHGRLSG